MLMSANVCQKDLNSFTQPWCKKGLDMSALFPWRSGTVLPSPHLVVQPRSPKREAAAHHPDRLRSFSSVFLSPVQCPQYRACRSCPAWTGWQDSLRPRDRAPCGHCRPAVITKKWRKEALGDACWSAGKRGTGITWKTDCLAADSTQALMVLT